MEITIRKYKQEDLISITEIWNAIVEEGTSFPQEKPFSIAQANIFFAEQSYTGVAVNEKNEVVGIYILHPNNVGRCSHIANASYGVKEGCRGQHIGEKLVLHSLDICRDIGFSSLQFNAVVCTNVNAIRIYDKLGFARIGSVQNGFRYKDGSYADVYLFNKKVI